MKKPLFGWLKLVLACIYSLMLISCGGDSDGTSITFLDGTADPAQQNNFGGAGSALHTPIAQSFQLFQDDWVSKLENRDGGTVQRNGVSAIYSIGVYADPNDGDKLKLFVNDRGNNRVLIFNSIPTVDSAEPDVVVGQIDFTTADPNAGGATPNATGFANNVNVSVCGNGMMFVADRVNNRVLGFNTIPTVNGAPADLVIGQPDFTSNASGTSADTLTQPYAAHCIDDTLMIADKGNHRVLVFDPIPTATNPVASFAIGQPDMITGTSGCAADKLNNPYEIVRYEDEIYIADGGNHRVIGFNTIPTTDGEAADVVLGQTGMDSCLFNKTGVATPSDTSLYWPNSLATRGDELAISDHSNNRIMFFELPAVTNQEAFAQFGQPDFVTSILVDPPTATSVGTTKGLVFDDDYIWASDGTNKRLGVFPLPY